MPSQIDNLEETKVIIQAAGYFITWVIVCIGWIVNNNQNQFRDDRKELRDLINDIGEVIRNVEADAVAYLMLAGSGTPTASYWTVFLGVQRVNSTIVRNQVFKTSAIENALIQYRKALTNSAMPGPSAPAKTPTETNKDLRHVSSSGNALIRALEEHYAAKYPRKN